MTDQKADVDTCPLVSVCIPTYNRCEQLKTAVESVLKGSYDHVAIIISDNASSDGTQEWCESVCAADNRVSYFRHEVNQGPTRNFEFARSKANGQYFVWLGDDDYLSPDYIEVCVAALEADASLVLVSGVGRFHTGNVLLDLQPDFFQLTAGPAFVRVAKYLWLVGDNSIYYGIYRSEMVENISLVNCIAGDWVWMAEVLARGKAKMVDPIIVHREQGDNTSSSMEKMVKVLRYPPERTLPAYRHCDESYQVCGRIESRGEEKGAWQHICALRCRVGCVSEGVTIKCKAAFKVFHPRKDKCGFGMKNTD
ncbi:MAG: glycosyltransferase family 2 protein [Gammaproteobacteria bacterium]|nr:glycosyltransferase family 2 protein [Gammaproteobacteria bacterium]